MNRGNNKESPNVSLSSSSSNVNHRSLVGSSLMNGNGHSIYRRSPISQQQVSQQPQSFDTIGSPSHTSYNSEVSETNNSFEDDNINELSLRFEQFQRQIEVLTETQATQDERYKRTRQENDLLLNKIHSLEDQLRELELNSEARAKEDEKRFKETMAKQMKVQSQECEQHLHANFLLQQDLFKLKNELIRNEALIKTLRGEKEALEVDLQDKTSELANLDEEIHKLKLLVKKLREEENVKSNLISILNEELEDSHSRSQREQQQPYSNNQDHSAATSSNHNNSASPKQRSSSSRRSSVTSGFGDEFLPINAASVSNNKAKDFDGLEMSLMKLREENKRLKETNEELQAQLLNVKLEEGRSLVEEGNKSYSLADELGDIDIQKLMKALKEQQDDNNRLRKYIDSMTLRIVDYCPELLDKSLASESGDTNHNQVTESSGS